MSSHFTLSHLKKTRKVYLFTLGTIFILSLLGQLTIQWFIYVQKDDSKVINLAGRQRMLSQRIALLSISLEKNQSPDSLKNLETALNLFIQSHKNLRFGNAEKSISEPFNKDLKNKYSAIQHLVDQIETHSRCIISSCATKESSTKSILTISNEFLPLMNAIVFASDDVSKNHKKILSLTELGFFILTLIVIAFEIKFILVPTQKKIIEEISRSRKNEILIKKEKLISQKSAKLASVGQLASGVGHEINNPLAIILGFVSIIEKKINASDPIHKQDIEVYLDRIAIACGRIAKIVKGLRALAREETNGTQQFDPFEAAQESFDMIEEIYKGLNINVELKFNFESDNNANSFYIIGDRGNYQQVLLNLLSNAKDAVADSNEKTIEIVCTQSNDQFILMVKDSGQGIEKKYEDQIFNPFFTTKEVGKGTGIGLSISSDIVHKMNGQLNARNSSSQGAVFELKLPIKTKLSEKPEATKRLDEVAVSYTALVVEDEVDLRLIFTSMLRELNIKVDSASNGKEALEIYLNDPDKYDFVITDIQMPVMDGETLINKIRELKNTAQAKIIVSTGGVNQSFVEHKLMRSKLIDGIIYKPYNKYEIAEVIKKCGPSNELKTS